MKYKALGMAALVLMICCTLAVSALERQTGVTRYHQHLSAEVPQETCACDGTELCTHLPIIRINTGGQEIPGNVIRDENDIVIGYTTTPDGMAEIVVTLETVEREGTWHHASDPADQAAKALFRIRGNSSRSFDKKNYRIKLVTDETASENLDLSLLGMNPDNDWALHGPYLDKTLLRNYMWMNISAEIMGYAPDVRFCEVILDGEYQGVYVLMETIKQSDYRVRLSEYQEGSSRTSYLLLLDNAEDDLAILDNYTWYTHQLEFGENSKTGFQILYPNADNLTREMADYIARDISEIERGFYSADMVLERYPYEEHINVESFVDYYILQELLANNDGFSRSTYLYRDVRGTLHIGPVWDYNNVLDNFFQAFSWHGFFLANRSWYGRLMTNERFVERVIARYRQLRRGVLSDDYLDDYIDGVIQYLGPAIERNDSVWGYSYNPFLAGNDGRRIPDEGETMLSVNPSSYRDAVARMKEYLRTRAKWMDENIETLRQFCHPSKTASERVE